MIKVNTKIIAKFDPCQSRFDNWKHHYSSFNGDIIAFLDLLNITQEDKIWVAVRILPREVLEQFAVDCSFSATAHMNAAYYAANAAYAAYAAYVAAYAAYAVNAAAERNRQIEALIYLIQMYEAE
jgi:hypothetical protein